LNKQEMIEYLKEAEETTMRLAGKKFFTYPDTRLNGELILTNYYLGKVRRQLEEEVTN